MACARSSFPDPPGPSINTIDSLSVMLGKMSKSLSIRWLLLTMSWNSWLRVNPPGH